MSTHNDPASGAPPPPSQLSEKDARTWAMLCHLSSLAGYVIPFGNIFGPLLVWQLKKNEHPLIDTQGKESLNFQISFTIYMVVAAASIFCVVGIVLLPALAIAEVVFVIIASIKANNGEDYRYPLTIRMIT